MAKSNAVEILKQVRDFAHRKYTSIGSYPLLAVTSDGGVLCSACCKAEYRQISGATRSGSHNGWAVEAVGVNWEDPNLFCDNCGERIESAYAEDEVEGKTRKNPSTAMPKKRIAIAFETWTPEDVEFGDTDNRGWAHESGVDMTPDKYDIEEGVTAVEKAIRFLKDEGVSEASSSHFHKGVWYTNYDYDENIRTGEKTTQSYFLKGFSNAEEEVIFKALKARR